MAYPNSDTPRITIEQVSAYDVKIKYNEEDISHAVTAVKLFMTPGGLPSLLLDFAVMVTADIEPVIHVPDSTAKALVTLGWTPPTGYTS